MKVEKISIDDAKSLVRNYCSALDELTRTGKVTYPLNMKKHSVKRIINSFKLYHASHNNELYKESFLKRNYNYKKWDDIRDILSFIKSNNLKIDVEEINMESLEEDYKKFLEIADNLLLNDELYYDRVYVLIGIKKPLFFFE